MKQWKIFLVIFILSALFLEEAEARRFRSSRGSRSSWSRRSRSKSSFSGSRSSRTNVHKKHSRYSAKKQKKYDSRSSAFGSYKKRVNNFSTKPSTRPQYIPHQIRRETIVYPVVFYGHSYGYWYGTGHRRRFVPIESRDYRRRSSSWLGYLLLIIFLIIVIFIIYKMVQASRQKRERAAKFAQVRAKEQAAPQKQRNKDPTLEGIYNLKKGQIVTMSDPLTLSYYDVATDMLVTGITTFSHETFELRRIQLINETDGEQMLIFVKEVDGDYCLYMGILDHEGRNKILEQDNWLHLAQGKDQFAEGFAGLFDLSGDEREIVFCQYDFGAFYNVISSDNDEEPVAICEYFPENAPHELDWQHCIVLWEGDWLSCYYCREIHARNLEMFHV